MRPSEVLRCSLVKVERMDFTIRGIMVDVDVLETSDGRGCTFSQGVLGTGTRLPVEGKACFYPTREIAAAAAKLWAESMFARGLT